MIETLIVILIVIMAAVYVGRVFYKGVKQKNSCACGCACCSISETCNETEANKDLEGRRMADTIKDVLGVNESGDN